MHGSVGIAVSWTLVIMHHSPAFGTGCPSGAFLKIRLTIVRFVIFSVDRAVA